LTNSKAPSAARSPQATRRIRAIGIGYRNVALQQFCDLFLKDCETHHSSYAAIAASRVPEDFF
jgi:hypothetical protein